MIDFLKTLPPQVWIIIAVGVVGLILLIGVRILNSKKLEIDVGPVDINVDKNGTGVIPPPAAPALPVSPVPPEPPTASKP